MFCNSKAKRCRTNDAFKVGAERPLMHAVPGIAITFLVILNCATETDCL